jgi:hypothetical protein
MATVMIDCGGKSAAQLIITGDWHYGGVVVHALDRTVRVIEKRQHRVAIRQNLASVASRSDRNMATPEPGS